MRTSVCRGLCGDADDGLAGISGCCGNLPGVSLRCTPDSMERPAPIASFVTAKQGRPMMVIGKPH